MTDFLDHVGASSFVGDEPSDPDDVDVRDLFANTCMECFCSSDDSECDWHWNFRKLVANLYQAALLCKAHEIAFRNAREWVRGEAIRWWPGCGRSAP